tara:strand:- start:3281 stop:3700 length:420 start_codon:yes stop_codon:yes gene_type:complete
MELIKYTSMNIQRYNDDIHLFKIDVLNVKLTQLKWIDTLKNFETNLELLERDNVKKFIMFIDAKYLDILSSEQIKNIVDLFTSKRKLFEDKLLCTQSYVEGVIINIFKDIFNKFYNPIKPIKFLHKNELDNEFIESIIN